jgi:hypothetical protein
VTGECDNVLRIDSKVIGYNLNFTERIENQKKLAAGTEMSDTVFGYS